jgi:hypothetical protein
MKLDKDTYHLAQDIYLRAVTNPNYKGGSEAQTAKNSIQQSVTFFGQWEATQAQVSAAASQAVETTKPVIVPPKPAAKPANGNDRQKLAKAPAKPLRVKAKKKAKELPLPQAWQKKAKR